MKLRTGFVSNSSSSSFIVSFEKDPANLLYLREMMGNCDPDYDITYCKNMPTLDDVIARVHSDIIHNGPATDKNISSELGMSVYWEADRQAQLEPGYQDMTFKERCAVRLAIHDKMEEKIAADYRAKNKGRYVYIFSYADDDGEAALEHGHIFRNVDHVRISHH